MSDLDSGADAAEPAPGHPRVVVRYWAAARAAAGRTEDSVVAANVADAVASVVSLHRDDGRFASVLAISTLLLGDRPVHTDRSQTALSEGDVLEVLPPFAGG